MSTQLLSAEFDTLRLYGKHGLLNRTVGRFPLFSLVSTVEFTEDFSSSVEPWKIDFLAALDKAVKNV